MATNEESISEAQTKRQLPAGCLIVFGGIFVAIGLLAAYSAFIVPMRSYWSARNWQQCPCVILTAELEESRGDDSSTWSAAFTYEYRFDNRPYVGKQDNLFPFSGSRSGAQQRLDQLPVGTETMCWVNPRQPQQALLDRSLHWVAALVSVMLAVIACGLGGVVGYLGWRQHASKRKRDTAILTDVKSTSSIFDRDLPASLIQSNSLETGSTQSSGLNLLSADDLADQQAAGPQRLKPSQTKIGKLLTVVVMCCFWNGLTWAFVWAWINNPPIGNLWGRIGMGLFQLPFVVVGLLLVWGVLHTLMSLVNPAVSIALSSGAVPLGGNMDVAWEVRGGWWGLRKLSVHIVGHEWARYVQGTDTRTDQSPFVCLEVVSTEKVDEIPFGTRNISIPPQLMHTLDEANNKIKWVVRVQGHIAWWPDVEADFPFRVTPPDIGDRPGDFPIV